VNTHTHDRKYCAAIFLSQKRLNASGNNHAQLRSAIRSSVVSHSSLISARAFAVMVNSDVNNDFFSRLLIQRQMIEHNMPKQSARVVSHCEKGTEAKFVNEHNNR